MRKILSRLFRVFVHVYIHHFDRIAQMGSEAHVNTCYKHFYYFVTEFNLIDPKELEPLVSSGVGSTAEVSWQSAPCACLRTKSPQFPSSPLQGGCRVVIPSTMAHVGCRTDHGGGGSSLQRPEHLWNFRAASPHDRQPVLPPVRA